MQSVTCNVQYVETNITKSKKIKKTTKVIVSRVLLFSYITIYHCLAYPTIQVLCDPYFPVHCHILLSAWFNKCAKSNKNLFK